MKPPKNHSKLFAVAAVVLSLTAFACSRSASLSGDVFVTMQSGDVKRGADVEILLVRKSPIFEKQWKDLTEDFNKTFSPMITRIKDLNETRRIAKLQEDRLWAEWMSNTQGSSSAYSRASDNTRSLSSQISNLVFEALSVIGQHEKKANELIRTSQPVITKTDVNGHYQLEDIRFGDYYVFARHTVFKNQLYWWVLLGITSSNQKFDLTNSNSGWLFSIARTTAIDLM